MRLSWFPLSRLRKLGNEFPGLTVLANGKLQQFRSVCLESDSFLTCEEELSGDD